MAARWTSGDRPATSSQRPSRQPAVQACQTPGTSGMRSGPAPGTGGRAVIVAGVRPVRGRAELPGRPDRPCPPERITSSWSTSRTPSNPGREPGWLTRHGWRPRFRTLAGSGLAGGRPPWPSPQRFPHRRPRGLVTGPHAAPEVCY